MKKSRSILITVTLLLVMVLPMALAGCGPKENTKNAFTDIDGVEITVDGPVDKILAVGTGVLRMLTYAGVQDKLVGIEETDTKPDNVLIKKPYAYANREAFRQLKTDGKLIGKGGGANPVPNTEAIVQLKPDVVFCSFIDSDLLTKLRADLKPFNIPVVKIFIQTDITVPQARQDIRKSFEIIGKLCGAEERCNEVVKKIDDTFADLDNRTKNVTPNNTSYIGAMSYRGAHGLDYTYTNFACLDAINTKSVIDASRPTEYGAFQVDYEEIARLNPEYIFFDISNVNEVRKDVATHGTTLNALNAVKKGNVYTFVAYNFYSTNIEYAFANSYYMGKVLYPEQFADVNMRDKVNELTKFFDGVELYDTMQQLGLKFERVEDLNAI